MHCYQRKTVMVPWFLASPYFKIIIAFKVMPAHNNVSRKVDLYCCLLPGLTFCAGKQSSNNSCPPHLRVRAEISSSHCWFDLIQISAVAALSEQTLIMVGSVCIVGPVSEWIMIRWAVTRGTDGQRNISLSVYTSHYLSTLCACWWTGTSPPSKHGGSQRSEARRWQPQPCIERAQSHRAPCDLIWTLGQACIPTRPLSASAAMRLEIYWHFHGKWIPSPICCCRHTRQCHTFLLLLRSHLTHLENGCLCSEHDKHQEWDIN